MATIVSCPASALAAAGIVGEWTANGATMTGVLDPSGARYFYDDEALAGVELPLFGDVDLIHPDDREAAVEYTRRVLTSGGPFLVEFRMVTPGGNHRWAQMRGYFAWNERGDMIGRGVIIDITDFRQPAAHFPSQASLRPVQKDVMHEDPLAEAAARGIEVRTALGRSGHGALRLAADLLLFEINTAIAARHTVSDKPITMISKRSR